MNKNIKELLIILTYDLNNFYNKMNTKYTINKTLNDKNYEYAMKKLNDELIKFKEKKGNYDNSIYINDELLVKKLSSELKNIINKCKYNIMKSVKNIKSEMIENELLEQNELDAENLIEHLSSILDDGHIAIYGGKITYF
jgi:gas vesicle protein